MNLREFLRELRTRRVVRALAAYAVSAFVVVQVADLIFEPLGIPPWALTFVVVLALLGAPVVAVMSWAFEWSDGRLERMPFGSAAEPTGARPAPRTAPGGRLRRSAFGAAAAAALIVALIAVVTLRSGGERTQPDPEAVAILPFDVSSADGSLDYLRDGLVVLLASTLSGDGGLRAVDPRASLAPVRAAGVVGGAHAADPQRIAARLGAGRWVTGEAVGSPGTLVVTGRMWTAGQRDPAIASVEGSPESLPRLVERLAIELIGRDAGVRSERISALQRAPLDAVREYVEGQRAMWVGEYGEANQRFARALEIDSTFALAALGLANSTGWEVDSPLRARALRLAWANRAHLNARDQAILESIAGPAYPAVPSARTAMTAAERAIRLAPDRPESVFQVADYLLHMGGWLGVPEHLERSERLFLRALELDPTFASPIQHLMEVALLRQDSTAALSWARRYLDAHPEGDRSEYARWAADALTGALDTVDAGERTRSLSLASLRQIMFLMAHTGLGGHHLETLVQAARERAASEAETRSAAWNAFYARLNTGRAAPWQELWPDDGPRWAVRAALHWGGDAAAAGAAVRELARRAGPLVRADGAADGAAFLDQAELELWRLHQRDTTTLRKWREEVALLEPLKAEWPPLIGLIFDVTTALVEAVAEPLEGASAGDHPRLDALNAVLHEIPPPLRGFDVSLATRGALVSAALHDGYGEHAEALAAVRRQVVFAGSPAYHSTLLREEGRLAALVGDREGAIRAYRRFLALRQHAEGKAAADNEEVRRALAALVGGTRD